MGAYSKNFTKDVDILWSEVDIDKNGVLDKEECKVFLAEIKKNIVEERAKNYDEANFDKIF
jgi:hypothetical protein